MTTPAQVSRYGFRYDPMEFVEKSGSLQASLVRRHVFRKPLPGDDAIVQEQIGKILADQRDDGSFGDTSKETGHELLQLLLLGIDKDRPEVTRAADAILRQMRAGQNADEWYEKGGVLSIYALHALCLLEVSGEPEVPHSLRELVEHQEQWNSPWEGCPWTPAVFWSALWAGREVVADVVEAVNDGIRRVTEEMNSAGCCAYNDPWGFTDAAGQIESAQAAALVAKQIPMILRGQQPDGGWGDRSLPVFRALVTHGLFSELQALPPLPPDWRIVRSIPAPEGDLFTMTWDGQRLWVYDRATHKAVAVSPEDGTVLTAVVLPEEKVFGIGWWGDALAVTQTEPKRLLQIDPDTGEVRQEIALDNMEWVHSATEVDDTMVVGDGFNCSTCIIDLGDPDKRRWQTLAGPGPACLSAADGDVWHVDFWAPAIIKSDLNGRLLDWGEKPFDGRCEGLAWDGKHLWALDNAGKRICVIEKADNGAE